MSSFDKEFFSEQELLRRKPILDQLSKSLGKDLDFSRVLEKTFVKESEFFSEQELLREKPTLDQLSKLKNVDTSLDESLAIIKHMEKTVIDKVTDADLLKEKPIYTPKKMI